VNDSPNSENHRFVIDFRDRGEEECRDAWPQLLEIVEKKVKPERTRMKPNGEYALRSPLPQRWWHHADKRPALYSAVRADESVLAVAQTSKYKAFSFLGKDFVYDQKLIVFPGGSCSSFAVMQSTPHLEWAEFQGSSMKDDPVYTPSLCYEPFSFPTALLDTAPSGPSHEAIRQRLEALGEHYHQFRADLMVQNNEGLTSTYNRFHDPAESSNGILELRRLHEEMDQAVLAAYGWSDALPQGSDTTPSTSTSPCGFGLDYLDAEDDALLPPDLQERIASGDLFFPTASEACNFQAQLRRYGAVKPSKKLPWRHRWPDAIRDDVLARLLALNAERYAKEQALGLHSKGGKAGGPSAAREKLRVQKVKASQMEDPQTQHCEQIRLDL
jgi:hypothetical protein